VEVDGRLEVLDVPEAAGHLLDRLNLAVDTLAHGMYWARNMLHSFGGEATRKFIGLDIGFEVSKSWFVMPVMSA